MQHIHPAIIQDHYQQKLSLRTCAVISAEWGTLWNTSLSVEKNNVALCNFFQRILFSQYNVDDHESCEQIFKQIVTQLDGSEIDSIAKFLSTLFTPQTGLKRCRIKDAMKQQARAYLNRRSRYDIIDVDIEYDEILMQLIWAMKDAQDIMTGSYPLARSRSTHAELRHNQDAVDAKSQFFFPRMANFVNKHGIDTYKILAMTRRSFFFYSAEMCEELTWLVRTNRLISTQPDLKDHQQIIPKILCQALIYDNDRGPSLCKTISLFNKKEIEYSDHMTWALNAIFLLARLDGCISTELTLHFIQHCHCICGYHVASAPGEAHASSYRISNKSHPNAMKLYANEKGLRERYDSQLSHFYVRWPKIGACKTIENVLDAFRADELSCHQICDQDFEQVSEILREFNTNIHQSTHITHQISTICKLIQHLCWRHAFSDCNGRTFAIALLNFLLIKHGYNACFQANPNRFDGKDLASLVHDVLIGMVRFHYLQIIHERLGDKAAEKFILTTAAHLHTLGVDDIETVGHITDRVSTLCPSIDPHDISPSHKTILRSISPLDETARRFISTIDSDSFTTEQKMATHSR